MERFTSGSSSPRAVPRNPLNDMATNEGRSLAGGTYGLSEPGTPDAQINYPTSELLPADDGQRALRQQIVQIRDLNVSLAEKARLMHAVMTEKYSQSQALVRPQSHHRSASPQSVKSHQGTCTPGSASPCPGGVREPMTPTSISSGKEALQSFNLSESDLEPTYYVPPSSNGTQHLQASTAQSDISDEEETVSRSLGCAHYKRNVKLQCSTCHRWYTCRFCHDEKEDHMLIRKETKNMLCMLCGCPQPAGDVCIDCGETTAWYYCDICKLWDNDSEKNIYHCNDCGICRVGRGLGKDFYHCKVRLWIVALQASIY